MSNIPDWLLENDKYVAGKEGNVFMIKTMKSIGDALSKLKLQKGHEKQKCFPALFKLIALVALIILVSASQQRLVLLFVAAIVLVYISTWPAVDIPQILNPAIFAGILSTLILLPSMIMNPDYRPNNVVTICKVIVCVMMVCIFNHTTQWNHITASLKKLKIPGIIIFILDITLKYIVLLGNLMNDLLTAMLLRSVGKNKSKYTSLGGILGVTFIHSTEMSQQMYEAMQCRGFTDDYKGI